MIQYKLIKEYPGSPKLGTIIAQCPGTNMYFYGNKQIHHLPKYPEFWETVIEKNGNPDTIMKENNKMKLPEKWCIQGGDELGDYFKEKCVLEGCKTNLYYTWDFKSYSSSLEDWDYMTYLPSDYTVISLDVFKQYLKQQNMNNTITQDCRFPFNLSPTDATKIFNEACEPWKEKLAIDQKWGLNILQNIPIPISESFYLEMRKSCTPTQNLLFDKIFGADALKCKFDKGQYIVYCGTTYYIEALYNGLGRVQLRDISFKNGKITGYYGSFIIEELNKDAHLWTIKDVKDGEPVWCTDGNISESVLRYADGKGEVYLALQKNTERTNKWKLYFPFDPFNLPLSSVST